MDAAVTRTLSPPRVKTYLVAAGWDKVRAERLYRWNLDVVAAFQLPLHCAEIALRNRIDGALQRLFGLNWYSDPGCRRLLGATSTRNIDDAVYRIKRSGKPVQTDQIVASLSFGFWSSLLEGRFNQQIWSTQLAISFPDLPVGVTRDSLQKEVQRAQKLRNRISHHEPLLKCNLQVEHAAVKRLVRWICPETARWAEPFMTLDTVLRRRP